MKESLIDKLKSEINKINERCGQLDRNIKEYKKENDFESAMKNDIQYRQLKIVSQSLKKLLT